MKKIILAATALFAGLTTTQGTVHVVDNAGKEIKKETPVKRGQDTRKTSRPTLEPDFPTLTPYIPPHTSPFFNPTRSMRVKNKINRKRYK